MHRRGIYTTYKKGCITTIEEESELAEIERNSSRLKERAISRNRVGIRPTRRKRARQRFQRAAAKEDQDESAEIKR